MLQLGGQEAQPGIISKHTLTHKTTEQDQTREDGFGTVLAASWPIFLLGRFNARRRESRC
jgi:hypothetical protein